jgi:predicted nucleic acid-binding protein
VVLIDTSVWVDFLRGGERSLALREEIADGNVLLHPWVYGELMLGHIDPRRNGLVSDFVHLDPAPLPDCDELYALIDRRNIRNCGVGWVDVCVLASALLAKCRLWTFDGKMNDIARELGIPLHA